MIESNTFNVNNSKIDVVGFGALIDAVEVLNACWSVALKKQYPFKQASPISFQKLGYIQ